MINERKYFSSFIIFQALFKRAASRLTLGQVLKVSFIFSLLWFMAHLASAEALVDPTMPLVQVLFSSSGMRLANLFKILKLHISPIGPALLFFTFLPLPGLFTLILAAIYPSSNLDKFTLSKVGSILSWQL